MAGKTNELNKVEAQDAEAKPAAPAKVVPVGVVDGAGNPVEGAAWEVLPPADVAYYYNSETNPAGASYPGVPLSNVLQGQFDTYPKWLQNSIKHSAMYSKEPPEAPAKGEGKKDAGDGGNK